MNNVFERLAKTSRKTIERTHGKAVTIFPISKRDVNGSPTLDADNPPWETVLLFFQQTRLDDDATQRYSQPQADGRRLMQRSAQVQGSIRLVDGKPLRTGFFLRREDDQALFEILNFDADGVGNVMAVLVGAKALPPEN